MVIRLVVFLTVVISFLFIWNMKNFYAGLITASAIATFGLWFFPGTTLTSLYFNILGTWYRFEITLTVVKIILTLAVSLTFFYLKYTGKIGADIFE